MNECPDLSEWVGPDELDIFQTISKEKGGKKVLFKKKIKPSYTSLPGNISDMNFFYSVPIILKRIAF